MRNATVLRVFAVSNFDSVPDAMMPSFGVYNEEALKRLDVALAAAAENGIRLILALSNFWPFLGGELDMAMHMGTCCLIAAYAFAVPALELRTTPFAAKKRMLRPSLQAHSNGSTRPSAPARTCHCFTPTQRCASTTRTGSSTLLRARTPSPARTTKMTPPSSHGEAAQM